MKRILTSTAAAFLLAVGFSAVAFADEIGSVCNLPAREQMQLGVNVCGPLQRDTEVSFLVSSPGFIKKGFDEKKIREINNIPEGVNVLQAGQILALG